MPAGPETAAVPGAASTSSDVSDELLAERAAAGSRDAFDAIVERHQRTVYHVCLRVVGNHEDASDLAQDAFVRAWRGLPRFKRNCALSTWLYRIAINTSLNHASARRLATEPVEALDVVDRNAPDINQTLVAAQRARAVRQALARLPRKQRATLILRAYQDLSHQEIADLLGNSVGTVKATVFHALANLRRSLRGKL